MVFPYLVQVSFIAQGLVHLITEQGLISASTILTIFDAASTLKCTQLQHACLDYVKRRDLLTVLGEIVNADENAGHSHQLVQLVKAESPCCVAESLRPHVG
jgi:hypothetical protein